MIRARALAVGPDTATASPRRGCRQLVALAVCMLPAAQRARYAEEFSDELLELPHDEQLGYALRLLSRSWSLRHVLNDSLRSSRIARPTLVSFAATAAVLVIATFGVGYGAGTAEPGDRLWSLTKVLYPEHAQSVEAVIEAHVQLGQASDALAQRHAGDAQTALERAQDELRAVNDEESRAEQEMGAALLRAELTERSLSGVLTGKRGH